MDRIAIKYKMVLLKNILGTTNSAFSRVFNTPQDIFDFFHTDFNHSLPCVPFLNKKLGVANCLVLGVILESVNSSDSFFHIMSYQ